MNFILGESGSLNFPPLSVFPKDCWAKVGSSSQEFVSISKKFECLLRRSSLASERISIASCLSFWAPATVGAPEKKSSIYILFNASLTVSVRSDLNDSRCCWTTPPNRNGEGPKPNTTLLKRKTSTSCCYNHLRDVWRPCSWSRDSWLLEFFSSQQQMSPVDILFLCV